MPANSVMLCVVLATCLVVDAASAADATAQDLQIIGRALSFKSSGPKRGSLSLAVVYNAGSSRSTSEMQSVVAAAKSGLRVGESVLRVVPVEQSKLGPAGRYDSVFTMSDVDQSKLRAALQHSGIPCFTLDAQQVDGGACTVAIRSRPSVSISINSRNAAAAGVSFATAFMMMVREL